MDEIDAPAGPSAREAGIKGRAARSLGVKPSDPAKNRAHMRSALKRVAGPPRDAAKPAAPEQVKKPTTRSRKTADRAAQAALGMMGRAPAAFDESELKTWLGALPPEQLQKLGKLVWAARQDKGEGRADGKSAFGKVERQLEQQGVRLDINAQTVTVNIGGRGGRSDWQPPRRSASFGPDWGRQWGRIKDFINGH